jgi:hypothetical protein
MQQLCTDRTYQELVFVGILVGRNISIRMIISDVTINTAKAILTSLILKKLSNFMLAVMLSMTII